jgi:hypothetical protein
MAFLSKVSLAAAFALTFSAAKAQTADPGDNDNAAIRYLGTQDDKLVFDLAYTSPAGDRFYVIIKDQDGDVLYQNLFNERSIHKQFLLPKPEKDRVIFVIRDFRDADIIKAFDVNVNRRIVREVAVRKVI